MVTCWWDTVAHTMPVLQDTTCNRADDHHDNDDEQDHDHDIFGIRRILQNFPPQKQYHVSSRRRSRSDSSSGGSSRTSTTTTDKSHTLDMSSSPSPSPLPSPSSAHHRCDNDDQNHHHHDDGSSRQFLPVCIPKSTLRRFSSLSTETMTLDRHRHTAACPPPFQRVTHILDLDGFFVENGFLCKELALIEVGTNRLLSEQFRLGRSFDQLSDADKTSVAYVSAQIHHIPFTDDPEYDRLQQQEVLYTLHQFLSTSYYEMQDIVVGYKGGTLELILLHMLKVNSLNLECIGCPKFDHLMRMPVYRSLIDDAMCDLEQIDCPLHRRYNLEDRDDQRSRYPHCAKHEVCVFRRWYLRCYACI